MIYAARCILTQNAKRELLENAALRVVDDRICDLASAAQLRSRYPQDAVLDLGNAVIAPGLINAHTHLPMSIMRGCGDDKPLMRWLQEDIFPAEAELTDALLKRGAVESIAELLRFGCTAFYDMYMRQDCLLEVADAFGIRGVAGENITRFFSAPGMASLEAYCETIRKRAQRWQGHPRLRCAVTPHAIYTTSPELLRTLRALADETGLLFGMHMAETQTENNDSLKNFGQRPLPYCRDLGILREDTSLFHCVIVDREDIEILAQTGAVPVHNPASNMKLGSGIAPVSEIRARGIPVGLGTDGAASNNAQNMVREMYIAALLGKLRDGDPSAMSAQDALDMATLGGAAALHMPDIGSLEIGKQADFFALALPGGENAATSPIPPERVLSYLIYTATGAENRLTVVAGKVLYKDGVFPTLPSLL